MSRLASVSTRKAIACLAAMAVLVSIASATGSAATRGGGSSKAAAPVKFDLPWTTYSTYLADIAFEVGLKKGFFKAAGLDPNPITTQSGAQSVNALLASNAPFASVSVTSVIPAIAQGAPLKIIGRPNRGTTVIWMTKCTSGITSVTASALRGKKIGITRPGSSTDQALTAILNKAGLTRSDVKVVAGGDTSSLASLLDSGAIDVAPLTDFLFYETAGCHPNRQLIGGNTVIKNSFPAVLVAKDATLKDNPQLIRKFFNVLDRSTAWVVDPKNFNEVVTIGMQKVSADPKDRIVYQALMRRFIKSQSFWFSYRIAPSELGATVKRMVEFGELKAPAPSLAKLFDGSATPPAPKPKKK